MVRLYTDDRTAAYVALVGMVAKAAAVAAGLRLPIASPVGVDLVIVFGRTTRDPKSRPGRRWHMAKPDRDNVDKSILDGLVGAGLLTDDCGVCDGRIAKVVGAVGEQPHVRVRVRSLAPSEVEDVPTLDAKPAAANT